MRYIEENLAGGEAKGPEARTSDRSVEVFHEGRKVRLRITGSDEGRVVMIPLRNGFPLYAADRTAQCFSVTDVHGARVGVAIRLPDYGVRAVFDRPPAPGDYFIRTQTPFGRA